MFKKNLKLKIIWLHDKDVLKECFSINFNEDLVYGKQLKEQNGVLIDDDCLDVAYMSFLTLENSHIPHQCTFIKKNVFEKIGLYNEQKKNISDWEFVMKALFLHNCTIKSIDVKMTVYDMNGICSIDKFKRIQFDERRDFLDKYFPLFMIDYDYYEAFMNKKYIKSILSIRNFINLIIR